MPTYVYECPECKKTVDMYRSVEDRDNHNLVCNCVRGKLMQPKLVRIIAPTAFILKGPGWAKDGYSK